MSLWIRLCNHTYIHTYIHIHVYVREVQFMSAQVAQLAFHRLLSHSYLPA